MNIVSIEFAAFVLLILVVYYLIPQRAQNYLLLIASYLFLVSLNIQFAIVFALLTAVNYAAALYIARKTKQGHSVLYAGIAVNLLALVFFKYANFFVPSAVSALENLGIKTASGGGLQILLPIGLSFFVVQVISYLLDVSRAVAEPVRDPVDFAVYMVYFPRMISGPIERSREFLPHLQKQRSLTKEQVSDSVVLIFQGLVRKVVIADLLFILLPFDVFTTPQKYSSPELAIWLVVYAFALYNDFAGYVSLVRGVSGLFGIPLSANFNVPYLARNFSEFWQRWHITLSNWLRDYIFVPVTRTLLKRKYSRDHVLSIILPPMTTMFVSALWHNVGWSMMLWGGMHGVYQVAERAFAVGRPVKPISSQPLWRQFAGVVTVFVLTALAWVPFRAELSPALQYWSVLLSPAGWISALGDHSILYGHVLNQYTWNIVALLGISIALDLAHYRFGELAIRRCPAPVQALAVNLAVFALVIALIVENVPPAFVYQGF